MSANTTDIFFYCTNPSCLRRLRAPVALVGKKIRCSRCPTKIVVPPESQQAAFKPSETVHPTPNSSKNIFDQDEFEKWLTDPTAPVPEDVGH